MTNQTPADILQEFLDAVNFTREIDPVEVSAHFFDRPFTDAIAALDDYYRQYYMGLLPEKLNIRRPKGLNRDAIWTAPQINVVEGYNNAIDDMRRRMEGHDE